jgi:hypothetical protein
VREGWMKTFVVYSDISPKISTDPESWILGIPKMLSQAKVQDVTYKTAYCCTLDGKIIAEFEGSSKDAVSKAFTSIEMPFTLIMEAIKVPKSSQGLPGPGPIMP